ncbi:MAG TPA: DNA-processing protein DprA, partial [Ilumatobacteraceae bacterium]
MSDDSLPAVAFAAALAGLDRLTPTRLLALISAGPWSEVWRMVAGDVAASAAVSRLWSRTPLLRDEWRASARQRPPEQVWAACRATVTEVVVIGSSSYPELLAVDLLPPPVLFARGDLGALDGRRVGIVGTRNATEGGRRLSARLGRELSEAGV